MSKPTEAVSQPPKLEQDAEFAHAAANTLNTLIDQGLITAQAVEKAPARILEEFIRRFEVRIRCQRLNEPDEIEKLSTLFPPADKWNLNERNQEREEVIALARNLLAKMQEKDERICGLLLFGSRLDLLKQPRATSDLDVIPIIEGSFVEFKLGQREPFSLMEETYQRHFPSKGLSFEFVDEYTSEDLLDIVERDVCHRHRTLIPIWTWNPEATYFIGKIGERSEQEVNRLIQVFCQSSELVKRKQQAMERIKERTKR